MNSFWGGLAAVQQQAKQIAEQAQKHATEVAGNIQDKNWREKAFNTVKGDLITTFDDLKVAINQTVQGESGDTGAKELRDHAITDELCTFVRGLNYSVFREYSAELAVASPSSTPGAGQDREATGGSAAPSDPAQANKKADDKQPLTQWQLRHAQLVLQRVEELQQLRFVLCPSRMKEPEFWKIYFMLCKPYISSALHRAQSAQQEQSVTASTAADTSAQGGGMGGQHRDQDSGAGAVAKEQDSAADEAQDGETELEAYLEDVLKDNKPTQQAKGKGAQGDGEGSEGGVAKAGVVSDDDDDEDDDDDDVEDEDLEAYLKQLDEQGGGSNDDEENEEEDKTK